MKLKSTYTLALFAATGAPLVTSTSLRASETDDRIESRCGVKRPQGGLRKLLFRR